jgi:hypothetical protein
MFYKSIVMESFTVKFTAKSYIGARCFSMPCLQIVLEQPDMLNNLKKNNQYV